MNKLPVGILLSAFLLLTSCDDDNADIQTNHITYNYTNKVEYAFFKIENNQIYGMGLYGLRIEDFPPTTSVIVYNPIIYLLELSMYVPITPGKNLTLSCPEDAVIVSAMWDNGTLPKYADFTGTVSLNFSGASCKITIDGKIPQDQLSQVSLKCTYEGIYYLYHEI